MQKEQTALAKDSNIARDTIFETIFDVLALTRKMTALRLFRRRKKKTLYLLSLNKKWIQVYFRKQRSTHNLKNYLVKNATLLISIRDNSIRRQFPFFLFLIGFPSMRSYSYFTTIGCTALSQMSPSCDAIPSTLWSVVLPPCENEWAVF